MRFPIRAPIRTILALTLLAAVPAGAQFSQYTAPGSLLDRGTSKKEQLEKAADEAHWRLGPFRLSPWLAVRDATYVSDVFAGSSGSSDGSGEPEQDSDFTVTAGAGVQGWLPLGPNGYFTVDALPQYVYWQKHEERRRLNGYYGVGLLGFFNRLTLQSNARRAEEQGFVTPEFEQRIHTRQDLLDAVAELRLGHSFYLFGSAAGLRFESLVDDLGDDPRLPAFEDLDREERMLRGGIEYRPDDRFRVAVGVERSETDFLDSARDRSNSGIAPVLEASYDTEGLLIMGSLFQRSLKPEPGSEFVPFDETTGRLQVTLVPRWRLSYSVYGSRDLMYSIEPGYTSFTMDRLGGVIGAKVGHSSAVDLFVETGTHDYAVTASALPTPSSRQDDFRAYGTVLHLQLGERLRLNVSLQRTELSSPINGDQSLTVLQSSLELSAFGGALTVR